MLYLLGTEYTTGVSTTQDVKKCSKKSILKIKISSVKVESIPFLYFFYCV